MVTLVALSGNNSSDIQAPDSSESADGAEEPATLLAAAAVLATGVAAAAGVEGLEAPAPATLMSGAAGAAGTVGGTKSSFRRCTRWGAGGGSCGGSECGDCDDDSGCGGGSGGSGCGGDSSCGGNGGCGGDRGCDSDSGCGGESCCGGDSGNGPDGSDDGRTLARTAVTVPAALALVSGLMGLVVGNGLMEVIGGVANGRGVNGSAAS
eukprot:4165103-Prymnesium_polylepis.1